MAKFLKVKVGEIEFLPIGFYLKIPDLESYSFHKQLLVLIAGPSSFIFSCAIIKMLYNLGILSLYGYEDAMISNKFILLFNLLPIYPLDGAKIIELSLTSFLNEYKLRASRIIISILSLVIFSSYLLSLGEVITMLFLFISLIISIINFKKNYLLYLISRLSNRNSMKIKINSKKEIYRLNDNYCYVNNKIIDEKGIISDILKKENLKQEIDVLEEK
ncbi:MAG: hypothetical protein E7177_02980 [Erysipelotrichaceae bacterium]|nr:hypothetical protein [Erysipelotrichaceae bacterium]